MGTRAHRAASRITSADAGPTTACASGGTKIDWHQTVVDDSAAGRFGTTTGVASVPPAGIVPSANMVAPAGSASAPSKGSSSLTGAGDSENRSHSVSPGTPPAVI